MLDGLGARSTIVRAFELHLLAASGYRPNLGRCQACGCEASALSLALVVPARGGVFCSRCRPATEAAYPLTGRALAALLDLQRNPIGAAGAMEEDAAAAEVALDGLIAHIVVRPLKSRAVLSALRGPTHAC